jgi:hypothetical protein
MQALFTTYATAVKKPVEDDSGGGNTALFWLKVIEFVLRFFSPSDRTRAEDGNTKNRYCQKQECLRQERVF